MSQKMCNLVGAMPYTVGFTNSLISICVISSLAFCDTSVNHFFCDITSLLALSGVDAFSTEIVIFVLVGFTLLGSLFFIIITYIVIISAILKIKSASGRQKAFLTCASASWVWLSSMGPWFSHICSLITHHPWPKHRWHLYSILLSFQCWIHSSIFWGINM